MQVTTTELAEKLSLSKGRISQYVAEGKLDGCFVGDGRARRFDLARSVEALGRRLDRGQMLGNGAETKRALADLGGGVEISPVPRHSAGASELRAGDPDRYEIARTLRAEEDARTARRRNEAEERNWVLASEVELQVARRIGQEVAEFEAVLRDGARQVADRLGVDFKAVRQLLIDQWRAHRSGRSEALEAEVETLGMNEAERNADA